MKNRKLIKLLLGIINVLFFAGYVEASFIKMNEETGVLTYYKNNGTKFEEIIFEPKIMGSDYKPTGVSYPERYFYKDLLEKLGLEKIDEIKKKQIIEFFANAMNNFEVSLDGLDDGSIEYDRVPLVAQCDGDEQDPYEDFDASYNHLESKFTLPKYSPKPLRYASPVVARKISRPKSPDLITFSPVTPSEGSYLELNKINFGKSPVSLSPWFTSLQRPQCVYQIGNISQLSGRESQVGDSGRQSMLSIQNQNDNQDDVHDID